MCGLRKLNVILGKSPGDALRKFGHAAYGLEAQKVACVTCFNKKFGKGKWIVEEWFVRDVSARKSKQWPKVLKTVLDKRKASKSVLATSSVCRMLRNKKDSVMMEDSKTQPSTTWHII